MPRIRTIKPEITADEKLARVSRDARLTFILAITQADDDGLLPGNARQLLAALYPTDEGVTDRILTFWITELAGIGVVRWRQTKQGAPVLEITNWANHQKVDHKGKSLLLPHLQEWSEDDAKHSRESRESVANVSRSDLGPRTVDLRPTSGASEDAPVARKTRPRPEPWIAEGVGMWVPLVGDISPTLFGSTLKTIVALHGWPAVRPDLEKWVRGRLALGKACNLKWYAGEASSRLGPKPEIMVNGELTEYGERITRPGKVSA